jgi:hypothetical protein
MKLLVSALCIQGLCSALCAQATTVVGVDANGLSDFSDGANYSEWTGISGDGRWVVFASLSGKLVPNDVNGARDVFVHDRATGSIEAVSVSSTGVFGNSDSYFPSISDDGRYVAFVSFADNLDPGDVLPGVFDVFVRDRIAGTTELISRSSAGAPGDKESMPGSISADGRHVAFMSYATNLTPEGGTPLKSELFVRDLDTDTTELVSVDLGGAPSEGLTAAKVSAHIISADGRFVAFANKADDLAVGATGLTDIFVRDRQLDVTEWISVGQGGAAPNGECGLYLALTRDGRYVAFQSKASNLVAIDTNGMWDLFLRDRLLGTTEILLRDEDGDQPTLEDGGFRRMSLSDDASRVVVEWDAWALRMFDAYVGETDVIVRNRLDGDLYLANVNAYGAQSNDPAHGPDLTADGSTTVFFAHGDNLVDGLGGALHTYVHDRTSAASALVYCTAKTTSTGCVPRIASSGFPSLTGFDEFHVTAYDVLAGKPGVLFWGLTPKAIPFGGGLLCVGLPAKRFPVQMADSAGHTAACLGRFSEHFSQSYMQTQGLSAGSTFVCQYWSRDSGYAAPNNLGLTDALSVTLAP